MGGGFNLREPTKTTQIHQNPGVRDILENYHWLGIFEKMTGYDDDISLAFSLKRKHPEGHEIVTTNKVLIIYIGEDLIKKISTLSKGIKWGKEERHEATSAKKRILPR